MNKFTISKNRYLKMDIDAYYHTNYTGFQSINNPDYINDLKNTFNSFSQDKLKSATRQLKKVLKKDLPKISNKLNINNLTVCVVPRAKAQYTYKKNQLLFKSTIRKVLKKLDNNFYDGTKYIKRHTDTKTTHLSHTKYGGKGKMPYPGITNKTCDISNDVKDKDILLIDDIYTKTVNIDEDVIQALLKKGAKSVTFYVIGLTV